MCRLTVWESLNLPRPPHLGKTLRRFNSPCEARLSPASGLDVARMPGPRHDLRPVEKRGIRERDPQWLVGNLAAPSGSSSAAQTAPAGMSLRKPDSTALLG